MFVCMYCDTDCCTYQLYKKIYLISYRHVLNVNIYQQKISDNLNYWKENVMKRFLRFHHIDFYTRNLQSSQAYEYFIRVEFIYITEKTAHDISRNALADDVRIFRLGCIEVMVETFWRNNKYSRLLHSRNEVRSQIPKRRMT